MRIVDLTLPIEHGMGRGGAQVKYELIESFDKKNFQVSTIFMNAHQGTHVDAPQHMINNTYNMENVPLESLVGKAVILDLTSKYEKAEPITVEDIKNDPFSREIKEGVIPVLRTDQTKKWGQKDFYDGPYLSKEAAEWLADRKIKACAYDFCEDYCVRKGAFRGEECVVHHVFLSRDIYNIEYLTNLDKLATRIFKMVALPLKLVNVEGAVARVIAIENEHKLV